MCLFKRLPYVAHKKPISVAINRKKNTNFVCSAIRRILHTMSAPATGARQ